MRIRPAFRDRDVDLGYVLLRARLKEVHHVVIQLVCRIAIAIAIVGILFLEYLAPLALLQEGALRRLRVLRVCHRAKDRVLEGFQWPAPEVRGKRKPSRFRARDSAGRGIHSRAQIPPAPARDTWVAR